MTPFLTSVSVLLSLSVSLPSLQVWSLAAVATDLCLGPKSDPDLETPWARHPFGRQLLESLYVLRTKSEGNE